jgi:hypothetical protein
MSYEITDQKTGSIAIAVGITMTCASSLYAGA